MQSHYFYIQPNEKISIIESENIDRTNKTPIGSNIVSDCELGNILILYGEKQIDNGSNVNNFLGFKYSLTLFIRR